MVQQLNKSITKMVDFEHLYEEPCGCGDALAWNWNEEDIIFQATCSFCFREYTLTPRTGEVEEIEG